MMRYLLSVYNARLRLAIATLTQYRASLLLWIVGLIVEPVIYMAVWTQVTREVGTVEGYSGADFAAYYLTWMLVRHFTVALSPDAIERRVRSGDFSSLLLLPIHPIHTDVADVIGYKIVALPTLTLTLLGLALVFPPSFTLHAWSIPAFVLSVALGFPIRFLFSWVLGLAAFWTTWARSIYRLSGVAEIFLTGRLAPLALLPAWAQVLAAVLPFRWMIAFPVEVLLGKLSPEEVLIGLVIQVAFIGALVIVLRLVWHFGIRRYSAVGT
jgi:ABC-2 type transport system permease protein